MLGRSNEGYVHDKYKLARRDYHYAVLRAKRNSRRHQAEGLLAALLQGDEHLMSQMKKVLRIKGVAQICQILLEGYMEKAILQNVM